MAGFEVSTEERRAQIVKRITTAAAGSAGDVDQLLDRLPRSLGTLKVLGIYDGDQRARELDPRWPHTFLPGTASPEALLREAANNAAPELAQLSGREFEEIAEILASLEGRDDHDWLVSGRGTP